MARSTTTSIATMTHHQRPSQRQLEDVLKDPDASWSEIREAMKSSRGCTNNAIMVAIARGRGAAIANTYTEKRTSPDVLVVGAAEDSSSSNKTGDGEVVGMLTVPLNEAATKPDAQEDITNSQNRRPSRRAPRKGSHRGSKKSSVRRQRSVDASINIMDFGVDHDRGMEPLNEHGSFNHESLSRMGSRRGSSMRTSESDNSSSGFLDWNHDDSLRDSGLRSNYSDFVDSSGFLDWQPSSPSPTPVCTITNMVPSERRKLPFAKHVTNSSTDGQKDDGQKDDGQKDVIPNEQWNIEDYENPQDNMVGSRRRPNFFTNQLKRLSIEEHAATTAFVGDKGINMEDIKEALMKVANGGAAANGAATNGTAGECNSAPLSRRCSLEDDAKKAFSAREIPSKGPACKQKRRRQTIIGMPVFLTGLRDEAKGRLDDCRRTSLDGGLNPLISLNKETTEKAGKTQESNIWDERAKSSSQHDDARDAIRINREDGGVDIEKECRKLYHEEQNCDEKKEKRGSLKRGARSRRLTLIGFERPKLSSKGTGSDDWSEP